MASQLTGEPKILIQVRERRRIQTKPVLVNRPRGYNPRVLGGADGKYFCSDCRWILRQPLQSFCGHRYCTQCFNHLLSASNDNPVKCQSCVQENTETEFSILKPEQTFPDNGIRREVLTLPAQCVNTGCDWKGSFKDYQSHEDGCVHKQVQCDLCGQEIKPQDLTDHKANQCPATPDHCQHCKQPMTRGALKYHDCDKLPVECPGCSKTLLKEELYDHSEPGVCADAHVPCVFGCSDIVTPRNLPEHLRSDLDSHICQLSEHIRQLEAQIQQNAGASLTLPPPEGATAVPAAATSQDVREQYETLERRVRDSESKLRELTLHVANSGLSNNASASIEPTPPSASGGDGDIRRQIEILDRKIVIFERVSAVFKREIEKSGRQIEDLLKDNQETKDRMESVVRQFQQIERQFNAQKSTVTDLTSRLQASEASSYDGVLVWKIDNVRQKRLDAVAGRVTSFYSPCFFTSRTGYKACARIYMNGDGMGKNTHISLFFVLMRGEYDALLPWPFQQKVTLMWLDQSHRDNVMDTFRPDPTSSSFKRPTSDMNIASGCPLFVPLATLDSPTQSYVKDDTAFIKIIIDKLNL